MKRKIKSLILLLLFFVSFNISPCVFAADAFEDNYQETNAAPRTVSAIEKLFNGEEAIRTGKILRQIGYNLFNSQTSTSANSTGKFNNNYKLSIGEKVSIYLYGDSVDVLALSNSNLLSPVIKTEVDSKGNIFIQGLGVVSAENKTISQVESALNSLASQKYSNLTVKVSVSSGQDFSVFVYGHVKRPGKVLISNNSTLVDAIGAAGGINKTGSLRKIKYTSGNYAHTVDLYKALFLGNDENIILKPNDRIFVNSIGTVVALKNGVTVPGIYELNSNENLQNAITYAGGLLAGTQAAEVVLTTLNTTSNQREAKNISWADAKTMKFKNGDSVEFKELYNEAENTVTIQGNIKHPATFAYKEGMRLSDILKDKNELLEETFLTQAVIRRVTGPNNTVETIPVFLKEFFSGVTNPVLQPRDVITIYKNTNARFVDVYGCINEPKHIAYHDNLTLSEVLSNVQFVESNFDDDVDTVNVSYSSSNGNNVLISGTTRNNKLIPAERIVVEIISPRGVTQLYYLYDIMISADRLKGIKVKPGDKVFFRTLRDNENVKIVKVSGFVRQPSVFKFVEGKKLTDMIEMAGGLTDDADLTGIIYKRKYLQAKQVELAQKNNNRDIKLIEGRMANEFGATDKDIQAKVNMIEMLEEDKKDIANNYTGQIALKIDSNDISKISDFANIDVQDGDEIYIPRLSNYVSVIGEVYNEQSFVYKKGAKARSYIKEVGGFTPNASKFRMYKVSVNGTAEKISGNSSIKPGDTIIVPRKVVISNWMTPIMQGFQSVCYIAITAMGVSRWK